VILTDAQQLKFQIFEHGLSISPAAYQALRDTVGDQPLSSADFASTSGIILRLDDDVWVNAPVASFNPNFVKATPYILDREGAVFVVHGDGLTSRAHYWPQPAYHGMVGKRGRPLNDFVVTHGDRARLSPIQGCGMACKFCNVPYEDRYSIKPVDAMVEAVRQALNDPLQPARHLLISGGTPLARDIDWLKDVYRTILATFSSIDIDIMMVPTGQLLDVDELQRLGLHQLSINLELFSDEAARHLMPHKFREGRQRYLDFIESAVSRLGQGRVRSMLMVGLEPQDQTLLGVQAIIDRGGIPVLSPFRPDPASPLALMAPPRALELEDTFVRASEIAARSGVELGPDCLPCTHNTLTLASPGARNLQYRHSVPNLV
jgi:hypothetical protein